MATGILLARPPFFAQDAIQLRIDIPVPLAQMLALAALIAHTELAKNSTGRRIVPEMRSIDSVQPQILKSVTHHLSRGFGCVTLSPIRDAEPVANLSMLMLQVEAQSHAANLPPIGAQRDCQPKFVGFLSKLQEASGILLRIRMRDAQRSCRDFARANQRQQLRNVSLRISAQPEPRRFKRGTRFLIHRALASAMPANAPPRHSRLLPKILASISVHCPCSKKDMLSNA